MHPATLVTLNMRELDRLKVIQAVVDRVLKPGRAAERLGLTVRQIERLVIRYRESGAAGLVSRKRGRPGNRRLDDDEAQRALAIIRERYPDFGPTLACEKLVECQGSHWPVVLLGVALWGLHMGLTQGLLATMVAHAAPPDLKGTAFGIFNLMSGLAMLVASVVAGELWDQLGGSATFYAGAGFCIATLFALVTSTTTLSSKA